MAKPAVLGYSFESNIEPSLAKLQARLGLSEAQLCKVVVATPSVIGLSFESNIEPKLNWLQRELALSDDYLREAILASASRLGYSLEGRYKPRLKACRLVGADDTLVLRRISISDTKFSDLVGVTLDVLRQDAAE